MTTIALAASAACSPQRQSARDMQSSGSIFTGVFCGGEGNSAPEAADGGPNACSDIKQVMPEFFLLLEENQLTGIQQAVEQIGQPVCADEIQTRGCTEDTVCTLGVTFGDLLEQRHRPLPVRECL